MGWCADFTDDHTDDCQYICPKTLGGNLDGLEGGEQLHITMFKSGPHGEHRDLYAHVEPDWRVAPLKHLRSNHVEDQYGARYTRHFVAEHSYLTHYNKDDIFVQRFD